MKEQTKCFILSGNGYEEITYAELVKYREDDPTYNERHHFIESGGMLMEVSKAQYDDFEKDRNRQRYIRKESKRVDEVSLDALDTDEFSGSDIVVDLSPQPDELVMNKFVSEMLYQCLDKLTADERELIDALYFYGMTEKKLSEKYGISQQAVSKRHLKIIRKMKKIMQI